MRRRVVGILELPGRMALTSGRTHPWLDLLMAGVLLGATLLRLKVDETSEVSVGAVLAALITAAGVACAYRWPRGGLIATVAGVVGFGLLDLPLALVGVGVVVALFYVGLRRPTTEAFAITLGTVVVLLIVRLSESGPFSWTMTLAPMGWLFSAGAFGSVVRIQRAYAEEMAHRAELAERTREQEARQRVSEERLRIARELHDVIGHSIALINVQAGVAAHVIDNNPAAAKTALERIADTSGGTLREIRGTLGLLREDAEAPTPTPEPLPGTADLERLVADARAAGLPVELTVQGVEPEDVISVVRASAYRVVQECLTNVMKHGQEVTRVLVLLRYTDRSLELDVVNDGGPVTIPGDTGHGLAGMRERVLAVGGQLDAGPEPGGGFAVRAVMPLRADP